jgi:hypothetical protein
MSPGFYLAVGDAPFPQGEAHPVVRWYWNLRPEGAVVLMHHVTARLNQAQQPFRLKVLKDPVRFTRCDAGVLYVPKADWDAVAALLAPIYATLAPHLKPGTPVLTKALAPGLGIAEDPGQGESFGLHRCRLLAEGMLRAYEQRQTSVVARLHAVVDRFAEEGLCLETPFVNPGSRDIYHFVPQDSPRPAPACPRGRRLAPAGQPRTCVQTAAAIGRQLVQEAVWDQERCNWVGFLPDTEGPTHAPPRTTYRALEH